MRSIKKIKSKYIVSALGILVLFFLVAETKPIFVQAAISLENTYSGAYTDKGNSLETYIDSNIYKHEKVEISKNSAEVKLNRWGGEENIVVKRAGLFNAPQRLTTSDTQSFDNKNGKEAFLVEPVQSELRTTNDGIKIDILLKVKPSTNVFNFDIAGYQDLDFFYQPPLNQERQTPDVVSCTETECFDRDGKVIVSRPEDVVGSYAVYHKYKKDHVVGEVNYGTGKLFHIYRPKIIDASGREVWAKLSFSNGKLGVTVPQNFIDTATYPVRVDPTFGYTSIGASSQFGGAIYGSYADAPAENGSITKISTYVHNPFTPPTPMGTAIYSNSTFGVAQSKLAEDSGNASLTATAAWVDTNLSYDFTASTRYWLLAWANGDVNVIFYHDSGATGQTRYAFGEGAFETWPASPTASGQLDRIVSIYATYTEPPPTGTTNTASFRGGVMRLMGGMLILK